jgi:hypothetical protein
MRSGRPNAVETAASAQHDRADDLLGAVVPLRIRERLPATSEKNDLSNVIPFHPRHHRAAENDNAEKPAPAVVCNHNTRPCPFLSAFDWRKQWPLLLVGSVAAHAGLFTWLMQEPPPKASIGLEVIAVEMVVGAQSEAGTAKTPGQTSVENGYRPDLGPPDAAQTELTEKPVLEAKDEPKEIADKPKPVAQEEPKPQFMAAAPPEPRPEPELAVDPEPKKEAVVEAVKEAEQPVAKKPVKETGKAKKQRIAARWPWPLRCRPQLPRCGDRASEPPQAIPGGSPRSRRGRHRIGELHHHRQRCCHFGAPRTQFRQLKS